MAKTHCLLFDAFSAKTSPDLWTEEFLVEFFNKATAGDALISTYASRTALKNALKRAGFLVEVREGFKGKRNSTLASKGLFSTTVPVGTSSHIR
jgi:tRNA U34 5-methylaminomethyl-2-thiouridine-forming methyltransferase MnmC